jgi:hypothetical protein
VIVCGSRGWTDRERIADRLFDVPTDATIVHGAAKGADRIAEQEAQKLGLLVEPHDYRQFIGLPGMGSVVTPKTAPIMRNAHMADLGADLCIAFWDGRSTGTLDMMSKAVRVGIPVDVVMERVA